MQGRGWSGAVSRARLGAWSKFRSAGIRDEVGRASREPTARRSEASRAVGESGVVFDWREFQRERTIGRWYRGGATEKGKISPKKNWVVCLTAGRF